MDFKLHNGSGSLCGASCGRQDRQLNTYDWLADIPGNAEDNIWVEVQFKNTRKGYYKNSNLIPLQKGDVVAVEASPGHDIGVVTLTGRLVPLQMKKANLKSIDDLKRIYRKAKQVDMEKFHEAKQREHDTMIRARQIALNLHLDMKIGDVEYQGDGQKAIFYYIAEGRVDFRQLIKVLADAFKVRIEMKQIGARQEAGLIGGVGVCGQALCCSRYMNDFQSITTQTARCQDLSLNPQKLAGQCGKLKCCINYEAPAYIDAQTKLPRITEPLHLEDGDAYLMKTDILKGVMWFSYDPHSMSRMASLTSKEVKDIIFANKKGAKAPSLFNGAKQEKTPEFFSAVGEESISRFDTEKKKKHSNKRRHHKGDKHDSRDKK